MAWILTRGLATVRAEFNTVFPGRDKSSDGSVGDLAHQGGLSGHNPDRTGNAEYRDGDTLDEVRAIDVDADLVPGSSIDWMERVIQYLVRRARAGNYIPFEYLIYKRRIWSRSDGWVTRVYTGSNDHNKHAHASGRYNQAGDNWSGTLGLATVRGTTTGARMFCKFGDQGDAVKRLQYLLHNLGYPVGTVDGDYGTTTARALSHAITAFNGSVVDGRTYGPAQEIFLSIMWIRKYSEGAPGKDGTLTGTLTVQGGTLHVTTEGTAS